MELYEQIELETRPIAIDIAKYIMQMGNERPPEEIKMFAGQIASTIFQYVLQTFALDVFKPGSEEGLDWIKRMYDQACEDAKARFQMTDIQSIDPTNTH